MAATVSYDDLTPQGDHDPNANLNANTEYRVTLTRDIVDLAKNPLATTTWKFRTGRWARMVWSGFPKVRSRP